MIFEDRHAIGILMKEYISKKKVPMSAIETCDSSLKKTFFKEPTTIIYYGHRPLSAIFIHSGEVRVMKKRKILERIGAGNLIMQEEYIGKKMLRVELVVAASTLISWVGADTLHHLV